MAAASAIRHAVNLRLRTHFLNPHKIFFSSPTLLMSAMASDRRFSYNGLKSFNGYGTKTPFLIGVAGGTASGKVIYLLRMWLLAMSGLAWHSFSYCHLQSTVCSRIMEKLGQGLFEIPEFSFERNPLYSFVILDEIDHRQRQVVCISQDSFYRELNPAESIKASKGLFNFDHPGWFNLWRIWITIMICLFYTPANTPLLIFIFQMHLIINLFWRHSKISWMEEFAKSLYMISRPTHGVVLKNWN